MERSFYGSKRDNRGLLSDFALFSGALVVTLALLEVGVSICNKKHLLDNEEQTTIKMNQDGLEAIIYEPYEYVFFKRYEINVDSNCAKYIYDGQIEVPEGYEILAIKNYSEKDSCNNGTRLFDIWFVNTETVEVESGKIVLLEENEKIYQKIK